jgi:hypothetical protein
MGLYQSLPSELICSTLIAIAVSNRAQSSSATRAKKLSRMKSAEIETEPSEERHLAGFVCRHFALQRG